MSKVSERKAKLFADLIDSAETRIAANGVNQLRARDLAKDVECSVGAIYNAFDDLDALILHVSARTLKSIDDVMQNAGDQHSTSQPVDTMVSLSWTYLDFVEANTNLWRGLFDHVLPADYLMPEWVSQGQHVLFRHIERPLRTYMPNASDEKVSLTSRMLFSSVHGVVSLTMDQRISGLPQDRVREELEFLIRTFVSGLEGK